MSFFLYIKSCETVKSETLALSGISKEENTNNKWLHFHSSVTKDAEEK